MLSVTIERLGDVTVLHCAGRIVYGYETPLLCAAVQQYGRRIILDLREVEAIDAAGIGGLISLQAAGVYLELMGPSKQVREVLRVTELDTIFEIFDADGSSEWVDEGLLLNAPCRDEAGPGCTQGLMLPPTTA